MSGLFCGMTGMLSVCGESPHRAQQYINRIYSKLHIEGDAGSKRKRLPELFSQKT
ncbi:MAG: hypothetical protein MRZ82_05130 [Firmicutes bacterium]|nr:hypothetical protein [Bacillota bacterium]